MGRLFIRKCAAAAVAVAMLVGVSATGHAAFWTLQSEFSGGATPAGYLTVKIVDYAPNQVIMTLESHLAAGEFVTEWDFNVTPDSLVGITSAAFQAGSSSGTFTAPTPTFGLNAYQADGDGKYDIQFLFGNAAASRFNGTDTAVYIFTGAGLSEASFVTLSLDAGGHGPFYTAAHVQGIGPNGALSGWVTVPEPTTVVAGALLLLPFAASTIRRFRKS